MQQTKESITKILERFENDQGAFKQNFTDLECTQSAHFQCLNEDIKSVSCTQSEFNSKLDAHAGLLHSHSRDNENCIGEMQESNKALSSRVATLERPTHIGGTSLSYDEIRER